MKLYRYYYGICEHRICVGEYEAYGKQIGTIDKDGFLYLRSRDDDLAKQLFAEEEARRANACGNEELARRHGRRIQAILGERIAEV